MGGPAANVTRVPASAMQPLRGPGDRGQRAAAVQPEAVGYLVERRGAAGIDVGDAVARTGGALAARPDAAGRVGDVRAALELPAVREEGKLGHGALDRTAHSGMDDGCADVAAEDHR